VKRPGATRYMQFDPGTVTSTEGQLEMVADLQRSRPHILVLDAGCSWYEPNDSRNEGATILDDFIALHYRPYRSVAGTALWRLK
jgi:hypothetical protein